LAQLQHPHILPVFDSGQAEGYTYIIMPFVQNGTLTETLQGRPLPLPRIRQVITQVGDALNYAHAHGQVASSRTPIPISGSQPRRKP
jgi:serine/threonine-protein kinase